MKTNTKQEVVNLLAWYNLEKLPDDEKTIVENALKEDPSLKEDLLIEQSMAELVKEDKTLLDHSIFEYTQSRLDNVLAKIDALESTQATTAEVSTPSVAKEEKQNIFMQLKSKFDALLASSSHNFTYAVFAALTVVQLGLLVFFIVPSDNMDNQSITVANNDTGMTSGEAFYTPAMHDKQGAEHPSLLAGDGMILIVTAPNNIKLDKITDLANDVTIELLPNKDGLYRVRVNKRLSEIELQELKNELSRKYGSIQVIGEDY